MNKLIVAYVGGVDELATIRRLSERTDVEVIAVALDFGDGAELRELHDQARAAGAVRCHTLDVRDEFAREYVLPAIRAGTLTDADATIGRLARPLIARKLADIAAIEGAQQVIADSHGPRLVTRSPKGAGECLDRAARIHITFESGVPVAINDIPMMLTEVFESLSTMAAAHGIGGARPALAILHAAHRTLAHAEQPASGSTQVQLFKGELRSSQPKYATP